MSQYQLNERERSVLAILIDHYIRTAEPVGSRVLATKFDLGVSPATIRNTMADLEEQGLIEQPHTSAGRIPTEKGYRFYVDSLLRNEKLAKVDREKIKRLMSIDYNAVEDVLEQTARVLARVSSQLGVTTLPQFESAVLRKIDLIQVTDTKLMVVVTVRSGFVRTILLEVDAVVSSDSLKETIEILNEKLGGLTLGEIKTTIRERLHGIRRGEPQLLKLFVEQKEHILDESALEGLHADGTTNIVVQKEFQDHDKLREFLSLLEERKSLLSLMKCRADSEGIIVTIGAESNIDGLKGCSAVIKTYQIGQSQGSIGIIGPTRMEYAKLMSLVDYTARVLSDILSR